MSHLKDGLGKEEVQTLSGASLQAQNPYFTGSMTVISGLTVTQGGLTVSAGGQTITGGINVTGSILASTEISGANVYATTAVQSDTIRSDVLFSGTDISIAGSFIGPVGDITTVSGTNMFASTLVQSDTVRADVLFSGTNVSIAGSLIAPVADVTTVSGTNVFASTLVQADTVRADVLFSGTNVSVAGSIIAPVGDITTVSGTSVYAQTNLQVLGRQVSAAGTGSATTWGRLTQAGSAVTTAGSLAWVTYGTAFSADPHIVTSAHGTADVNITRVTGSDTPGSALFISHGAASTEFSWNAVGAA